LPGEPIVSSRVETNERNGPCAAGVTDPVEIVTEPLDPHSPFLPAESEIAIRAAAPASHDPIPIVLTPGCEYRMREWRNPESHQIHWLLERRKASLHGEGDG
jgi:hypothetical protein